MYSRLDAAQPRVKAANEARIPRMARGEKELRADSFSDSKTTFRIALSPKHRFDSKFVHLVNQYDKIVAEHLAQGLIDHRSVGFASQGISKLAFNHAKGGFDVGSLVVVLQKLAALELEVMVHLFPSPATVAAAGLMDLVRSYCPISGGPPDYTAGWLLR